MRAILIGIVSAAAAAACVLLAFQFPQWQASSEDYAAAQARISTMTAHGTDRLDLSDLTGLTSLPPEISDMTWLRHINLSNTRISDLSALEPISGLEDLSLNTMPVSDLTPLAKLKRLRRLSLARTWIYDITPIAELTALEDLNLSYTAVESLAPLLELGPMRQLTLYRSYAHDGSQLHFDKLKRRVVRLNNGTAYQQNYIPGWQYKSKIALQRLVDNWTLGGPERAS